MTAQLFSATDKIGVQPAQKRLDHLLRPERPAAEAP
jgi:hypothetical protein